MALKPYMIAPWRYWQSFSLKFKALLISVLVFAVFLAILPYGIKWGMQQALLKQGLEKVQIEDVSFNLFTGRFKVEKMLLKKSGKAPLNLGELFVDFDWSSLFEKRLVLEKVTLTNTQVFVRYTPNSNLDIAGVVIPLKTPKTEQPASEPLTWKLGLDELVLKNSTVSLIAPNLDKDIRFDKVALNKLQNWAPATPADISFKLAIGKGKDFGGLKGRLKATLFADTQKVSGKVTVDNLLLQAYQQMLPPYLKKLAAKVDGNLDLAVSNHFGDIRAKINTDLSIVDSEVQTQDLDATVKKIALTGMSNVSLSDKQITVTNNASLKVKQAAIDKGNLHLQIAGVNLVGQRQLVLKDGELTLDADESLKVHGAKVKQAANVLQAGELAWQGQAKLSKPEKNSLSLGAQGQLSLADWQLADTKQKLTLASLETMSASVDFHTPQAISVKDFQLDGMTLAQLQEAKSKREKLPLTFVHQLTVSQFDMPNQTNLSVGKVVVNGMKVNLDFDEDKHIHQLEAVKASLPKTDANKQSPVLTKKTAKTPLKWRFGGLKMTGDNRIELLTHATQPSMQKNVVIKTLTVGEISGQRVKRYTPFKLEAKVDKYTKIEVKGKAQPLASKVNLNAKTEIKDMDLYSFSPLIRRDLGYRIQSGSLNLTSDVKVTDNALTSKNHVLLTGFEMAADSSDQPKRKNASNSSNQNSGPLDASALKFGLDMLRDSHNNIDLNLPVEGDLSDPNFDATSAINAALKNALTGGTKLALTLALQPYGAIAMATSFAYDKLNKIQFQPVAFIAGENELAPDMPNYLDKMGKLLKDKKQIMLKVCGYYTKQDIELLTKKLSAPEEDENGSSNKKTESQLSEEQQALLTQQLYDLARARQRLVKDWLVEKGGIAPSRLTTCHPELQKETVTGVSLSM